MNMCVCVMSEKERWDEAGRHTGRHTKEKLVCESPLDFFLAIFMVEFVGQLHP